MVFKVVFKNLFFCSLHFQTLQGVNIVFNELLFEDFNTYDLDFINQVRNKDTNILSFYYLHTMKIKRVLYIQNKISKYPYERTTVSLTTQSLLSNCKQIV